MINNLILLGFGSIINDLTIEEMYGHYMHARNDKDLETYQKLGIDNTKNPFTYPYGVES